MRRSSRGFLIGVAIFGFLSLLFSGCLALSEDVTPPPDNLSSTSQPTSSSATQPPLETPDNDLEAPLSEPEAGSVVVRVVDQTGGKLIQEDLSVKLESYDEFELVFETSQDLPPSALVRFSDVPFQAGRVYFASVAYGGAVYRSEIIQVGEDTFSLDLQVEIFDTTTDTAELIIDRLHLLFDFPSPNLIQVSEIFILSNQGVKTIVAESLGQASVEFPLPTGAGSLVFEDGALGQRFLLTEDGFGDTVSIPPGEGVYQVVVSYTLPYDRNRLEFSQRLSYPLSAHVVLVPAEGVKVKNSSLRDLGVQSLPGSEIQVFSGGAIPRGEVLEFKLTGNPFGSPMGALLSWNLTNWFMIGLGVLGIGLLASGIWLYIRSRKNLENNKQEESSDLERDEILDSIIALEDLFQAGEISEAVYQLKRDQLKEQLKEISGNE